MLLGLGFLGITLIVQPPIQVLPVIALGINPITPPPGILWLILLYYALVSGFLQEFLKYIGVKDRDWGYALWLGGGFGAGEALYVAANQLAALYMGTRFPLSLGLLAVYERLLSLIYHSASSILLLGFIRRGRGPLIYVSMSMIHALMNYQAVYVQKTMGLNPVSILMIYGLLTLISSALSITAYWSIRHG